MDAICQIPYGRPTKMSIHTAETLLQQKTVKATFVRVGKLRDIFPNSHGVIAVSVGTSAFEGEKFKALMALVNRHFKAVDIAVNDTLQRHTLAIRENLSVCSTQQKAYTAGLIWIEKNKAILESLSIPYKIVRWDKWLLNPHYNTHRQEVMKLYQHDPVYKHSMENTIKDYLARHSISDGSVEYELAFTHCLNYLVEECAIIMGMWIQEKYQFVIYVGDILEVLATSHDHFVKPVDPHLLRWIRVKLKTKI
jgi:tRNA-dependent cyclodipeptide synthase